jgi:tRNA uridine 5-carbamoylmethylation protein Kti12
MNKRLILIRGLPGSGKSTLAQDLCQASLGVYHVETDDFFLDFTDFPPLYKFDHSRLSEAHRWCQETTRRVLSDDDWNTVIVSNTFTQMWEIRPYLDIAKEVTATVQVYHCEGQFENIHGVPPEVIKKMKDRWEPYMGELK